MADVQQRVADAAGLTPTPSAARTLGPYTLLGLIGRGGMGQVYLAHDERLGRQVAVKIVGDDAGPLRDPHHLLREARAVARLSHPNIATVYDVLETNGQTAIVMEYLRGETLARRIARSPLSIDETIRIGMQVTAAVAHAHQNNVLHCDLKPANVFLTEDGVAKVLDFGLARPVDVRAGDSSAALGASPTMVRKGAGTPAYMAPEHLGGEPIDARADVYSLGVTLHEMVAGRRPARGRAPVLDPSATTAVAPRSTDLPASVPPALRAVIARALSDSPEARYPSAAEMGAALEEVAHRPTQVKWRSRRVLGPLVLTLLLVAALTGGVWRWMKGASGGSAPPRTVLAVLPFSGGDDESSNRYLAAGVTEMLTSDLANSPNLVVVSAASAARAAGRLKDPAAIAKELGATKLLTGELGRDGEQIRVTLSVFDARSGEARPAGTVDARLQDVAGRRFPLLEALRERVVQAGLPVEPGAPTSIARASQAVLEDYARGRELLAQNKLDDALAMFERAAKLEPRFALAHAGIGEATWGKYRSTKDPAWAAKAQAAAFEAMRLAPGEAAVRYTAALILNGTGRVREAEEEVRRAIQLQPGSDDAHRLLGTIYVDSGRFDEAKAQFDTAIALRPGYADNYHVLGLAYFDTGRFDGAIDAFKREIELRPNASAFQALGTSYHALGRLDEALENYERAIAISPRPFAYSNIGMIHYAKGRYRQAVAAYEHSARLAPAEAATHRNLGDSLMKAGERGRARVAYQRAIDLAADQLKVNSRDGRLLSLQAVCEAKLGRRSVAVARIAQAVAASPEDNEVLYQAGVVHALTGDSAQAFTFLRGAARRGFSTAVMAEDEDLASLRKSLEFQSLLKETAASQGPR